MTPTESAEAFRTFSASRGVELDASTPRAGIETMLAFYDSIACDRCDDDVLLYQWGSYDWGAGEKFELNITRQLSESNRDDDDAISQLGLTYRYKTGAGLERFGAGNCWSDAPADFRQFIRTSAAFAAVADTKPDQIELVHSYV